jgi:hypothetical protein
VGVRTVRSAWIMLLSKWIMDASTRSRIDHDEVIFVARRLAEHGRDVIAMGVDPDPFDETVPDGECGGQNGVTSRKGHYVR